MPCGRKHKRKLKMTKTCVAARRRYRAKKKGGAFLRERQTVKQWDAAYKRRKKAGYRNPAMNLS